MWLICFSFISILEDIGLNERGEKIEPKKEKVHAEDGGEHHEKHEKKEKKEKKHKDDKEKREKKEKHWTVVD